jgi:ABC-type dipeptide/oligopeptide/nickel transport system permease subunit
VTAPLRGFPPGGRQQRPGGAGSALALERLPLRVVISFSIESAHLIALVRRWLDSDVGHSFRTSPTAIVAALIALVCVVCALFAPWVAPHNPFDLATLELSNARLPPAWSEGGNPQIPARHRRPGRDILSALMYGARISLAVGLASVVLSVVIGVALGLLAGFWAAGSTACSCACAT